MEPTTTKRGYVTDAQKNKLIELLHQNKNLQNYKFSETFTFKDAQRQWQNITDILNSVPGGTYKNWKQWRRTWQDIKQAAKRKNGGAPITIPDDLLTVETPVVFDFLPSQGDLSVTDPLTVIDTEIIKCEESEVQQVSANDLDLTPNIEQNVVFVEKDKPPLSLKGPISSVKKKKKQFAVRRLEQRLKTSLTEICEDKKLYWQKKIEILERNANCKERIARAAEKKAKAAERIASALERLATSRL